jgi:GST-like protein
MDKQPATPPFIAGDSCTITEIAIFRWLRSWQNQGIDWTDYPNLKKWFDGIAARPAAQRGVALLIDLRKPLVDDKARENMFGATQYQRR